MKTNNLYFTSILISKELLDSTNELSFTVKPSRLGGVGVFTTHGIKKNTRLNIFPNGSRFIKHSEIMFDEKLLSFSRFFGVETKEGFYIPKSFNSLDVGWYLNHLNKNNASHDSNYKYFSTRDIKAGEEITINYNQL